MIRGRLGTLLPFAVALAAAIFLLGMVPQRIPEQTGPGLEGAPTPLAQRIELKGVQNFAQVTPTLYRGGQPTEEGYVQLKELGIEIVVSLRGTHNEETLAEPGRVEVLGMSYVRIPWKPEHPPDHEQVATFLALVRDNPDKMIYVHCRTGKDRTAVMTAAYRIAMQKWTPEQALKEMEAFGFDGKPSLLNFSRRSRRQERTEYIRTFVEELASNPSFGSLNGSAGASQP